MALPAEPPAELFAPDPERVVPQLVAFIRREVEKSGRSGVVLGMSGGVDSSLVAHLSVRALGPSRVHAILMPFRTSSEESLRHAKLEIAKLGIQHRTIEITEVAEALFRLIPGMDRKRMGNAMARLRMAILFDQSEEHHALVIGTSNRTEILLGYGTIHGDAAWGLGPIGGLYKTEVRHLARALGVDREIVEKAPTADLWVGQTDEGELGVSYEIADRVLYLMIDRGMAPEQVVALGYEVGAVERVAGLVAASEFKRRMPPVAVIER